MKWHFSQVTICKLFNDIPNKHSMQKFGLWQLNLVSFVKKQMLTIRQSKVSEKNALLKGLGLAITPCSVNTLCGTSCKLFCEL